VLTPSPFAPTVEFASQSLPESGHESAIVDKSSTSNNSESPEPSFPDYPGTATTLPVNSGARSINGPGALSGEAEADGTAASAA
jgi:hypothetical protein